MDLGKTSTRLFVYGTLMPGGANHGQIEHAVHAARPATVEGVLVDLGAFPALLRRPGLVKGMLLDLDSNSALAITDRIEGYAPGCKRCLYIREQVAVMLDDGSKTQAWVYVFASPESVSDRPRLIVGRQDGVAVFAWRCGSDLS